MARDPKDQIWGLAADATLFWVGIRLPWSFLIQRQRVTYCLSSKGVRPLLQCYLLGLAAALRGLRKQEIFFQPCQLGTFSCRWEKWNPGLSALTAALSCKVFLWFWMSLNKQTWVSNYCSLRRASAIPLNQRCIHSVVQRGQWSSNLEQSWLTVLVGQSAFVALETNSCSEQLN